MLISLNDGTHIVAHIVAEYLTELILNYVQA